MKRADIFQRYNKKERSSIHQFFLDDGGVCVMFTKDSGKPEESFQALAQHQVPVFPKAKGWRLSWTIRTTEPLLDKTDISSFIQQYGIGDGLTLLLKKVAYDPLLKQELLADLHAHGEADVTRCFGEVLEQAYEAGQVYQYGGKTTAPGTAFGQHARAFLDQYAKPAFGGTDKLWAHLVFYPEPQTCKLSWHGDQIDGINPHMIMSVTFLEFPDEGVRPFEVRLNSDKEENKTRVKRVKAQPITAFFGTVGSNKK